MPRKRKRCQESTSPTRRKRRRAPKVLDQALDGRARSLEQTILSLLPKPPPASPSQCRCDGAACLACRGRRHLVRGDDPPEYKNLLRRTYCFVSPAASAPPPVFHRQMWDQRKIVRHVMEELQNSNVLSSGYDKHTLFSSTGEALCTHAWVLLLERIGHNLMVFLLRFSLIFLPLTNKSYRQVTGPILGEILKGHDIKRQRINHDEKLEKSSYSCSVESSGTDVLTMTSTCIFKSSSRKRTRLYSWQRKGKLKKMTSQCCYCCSSGRSDKDAAEYQINRRQIFYNTSSCYSTLPLWHILNRVKPNKSGAALLMKHIFGLSIEGFHSFNNQGGLCTSNSICLYRYLLVLLKSLIRNAQHCDRRKLLLKHCPFPISEYNEDETGHEVLDLAECYSTHQQVVSFIWAVLRSIIPPDLLGDFFLWRALRSNISKFVGLQMFEKFNLSQCLYRLETSEHPFLSKARISNCRCYKFLDGIGNCKCAKKSNNKSSKIKLSLHNRLFRRWIHWLFSSLVVPIVSTCFYVTERQFEKHKVFYYLKSIWRKLEDNEISCLEGQNYKLMNDASCTSIISKRKFGFSKVRLLPKRNKVRVLANTKAPCKIQIHTLKNSRSFFVKSVNSSLKELHAILRRITFENPQTLGCSVFGYDDVYQKLYSFLQKIKDGLMMIPELYIVIGDVAKAFDTIDQDKLVEIMKDVIVKDKYCVKRYIRVTSAKKQTRACQDHVCYDYNSCSSDAMKFEAATRFRSSSCVIIDQGEEKCFKKEELHHLLTEHLKHNILKIGNKFYLQNFGISHGSSISSLLCSFYLGHMERSLLMPYLEEASKQHNATILNNQSVVNRCMHTRTSCIIESSLSYHHNVRPKKDDMSCLGSSAMIDDVSSGTGKRHMCQEDHVREAGSDETSHKNLSSPDVLLLRWTDDFLFISTSKHQASSFFRRMERGFKEYNCEMNSNKFVLNFDPGQKNHLQNRLYIGADGVQFLPWSGLLLNCHTLEIQADYSRYLGTSIRSTITVESNGSFLLSFKAKLCDFMRPKCHPLFYDSRINSSQIVRLNAYQAFLLCAMKFHSYVRNIPNSSKLHPRYLLETIEQSFRFMYMLIKKQMRKMGINSSINPVLDLKKEEMIWLGRSAYIWVLNKKQARHNDLLSLLRCKISGFGWTDDVSDSLKYAVDDSHSSVFQDIHF